MEALFKLVPFKLLFLGWYVYAFRTILRQSQYTDAHGVVRFIAVLIPINIVLSYLSIGQLYPYGIVFDGLLLLIAAMTTSLVVLAERGRLLFKVAILKLSSIVSLIYLGHFLVVGGALNEDSIFAVLQTNPAEAYEYIFSFISIAAVSAVIIWLLLVINVARKPYQGSSAVDVRKVSILLVISILAVLIMPKERGIFYLPFYVAGKYKKESAEIQKKYQSFSTHPEQQIVVSKEGRGEVYIVVIGESLNKHHMSLYGYERKTTPRLDEMFENGGIHRISKSYSNYPQTTPALTMALMNSNQLKPRSYVNSTGIIAVLKKAGFETAWIGNQPLSTSYDLKVGFIAKAADNVILLQDAKFGTASNNLKRLDGEVLPHIERILKNRNNDKNLAVFVHLAGNHTNYCERYPQDFAEFDANLLDKVYMHVFKGGVGRSLYCYDNSVLYNDYVVSQVIQLAEEYAGDAASGVLYFADHSQDVVRGVGHSTANFSMDMVDSPALVWLSERYKKEKAQYQNFIVNQEELFPNDFVFDSIIGMSGISTDDDRLYCKHCDIFSADYELMLKDAKTMHGKMSYKPPKAIPSHIGG